MRKKLGLIFSAVGVVGVAVAFSAMDVVDDLVLLAVSLAFLVVGILFFVLDRLRGESSSSGTGSEVPSLGRTIGIALVLGVASVYLIISTLVVLIAGGWDLPASRQLWLGLLLVAYFVGGIVVLARSLARWKRGSRIGYALPLLIPLSSIVLLIASRALRPPVG